MGCSAESIVNCALLRLVDELERSPSLMQMTRNSNPANTRENIVSMIHTEIDKVWIRNCLVVGGME